jgi:putative nucleotidyltransferase with HDIG domain
VFSNLFKIFEVDGHDLYFVGGFCRDLLEARLKDQIWQTSYSHPTANATHPKYEEKVWEKVNSGLADVDFATSAKPEETISILESNGLKTIKIGIEFGTVQTFINDMKVEITTYRSAESYKKGSRKPSVVFGKNIVEDLARRDFTCNAIAMDKDLNITDPFGGQTDIEESVLFTPIDSEISFSDDPLRMLRCCRFVVKGFGTSNTINAAMLKLAPRIHEISQERIFEEVTKILLADKDAVGWGFATMEESGLLREIFPELQTVVDFKQNQGKFHSKLVWPHTVQVIKNCPLKAETRWAALFHDVAKPQTYSETETDGVHFIGHDKMGADIWEVVATRLKIGNDFKEYVRFLIFEHLTISQLCRQDNVTDKTLRRLIFRAKTKERLKDLFDLSRADITSHNPVIVKDRLDKCDILEDRIWKLMEKDILTLKFPKGTANQISEHLGILGVSLGKVMKVLIQRLEDGEISLESNLITEAKIAFAEINGNIKDLKA